MAADGRFTVVWASFGQDNVTNVSKPTSDYGIYTRMYNADGSDYKSTKTGQSIGEFRVNAMVVGDQLTPAVSVARNGRIATVWTSPETYTDTTTNAVVNDLQVMSRVWAPGAEGQSQSGAGPTISSVAVSQTKGRMSWSVASSNMSGCTLTIDNKADSGIGGPYTATSGVNYSVPYGSLANGTHNYTITATDKAGHTSTLTGSFVLGGGGSGPTIGGVATSPSKQRISWNVVDPQGVLAVSLYINGSKVSKVDGPFTAASGVNYSALYGNLAAGTYNYTIMVTDKANQSNSLSGSFTVGGTTGSGPTIGSVATSPTKQRISWNVVDSQGISGVSLSINGTMVKKIDGPFAAASGVNYSAVYGNLAAGTYSYAITVTDKAGHSNSVSGSFTVAGTTVPARRSAAWRISAAKQRISWNAVDPHGVLAVSLLHQRLEDVEDRRSVHGGLGRELSRRRTATCPPAPTATRSSPRTRPATRTALRLLHRGRPAGESRPDDQRRGRLD